MSDDLIRQMTTAFLAGWEQGDGDNAMRAALRVLADNVTDEMGQIASSAYRDSRPEADHRETMRHCISAAVCAVIREAKE